LATDPDSVTCIQDDVEKAKKILKDKLDNPNLPQYAHLRDHVIPMTLYSQQKPQLTKDAVPVRSSFSSDGRTKILL